MEHLRYSVAACQTDMPNPIERRQMRSNTDRILSTIDSAVVGSAPFLPVRLVLFSEVGHAAPGVATVPQLVGKLGPASPARPTPTVDGQSPRTAHSPLKR